MFEVTATESLVQGNRKLQQRSNILREYVAKLTMPWRLQRLSRLWQYLWTKESAKLFASMENYLDGRRTCLEAQHQAQLQWLGESWEIGVLLS